MISEGNLLSIDAFMARKTSFILLILLLILILVIGITPYVSGIKAEDAYNKWVEQWAVVGNLRVISKRFDRGWFSSNAETIFEYPRGNRSILMLSENDTVIHGPIDIKGVLQGKVKLKPFLARIETKVTGNLKSGSELSYIFMLVPPLEMDTTISFQGSGTSKISMQSFSYRHENLKESVIWKGLKGNATFDPRVNEFDLDVGLSGLEILDGDFSVSLSDAELHLDFEDTENEINSRHDSISFKTKNIEIRNFSLGSDKIKLLALIGLDTSWSSSIKDRLLNGSQKINLDNLVLNDLNQFGPGTLEFSVRNVDVEAFHEIRESVDAFGGEVRPDQQKGLAILSAIIQYLPQLVDDSFEFEITRLSLVTSDGEFLGRAKVSLGGNGSELKFNPFHVIDAVSADAMISVPKNVFEFIIKEIAKEELVETFKQKGEEIPGEDEISLLADSGASEKIKHLLQLNIFIFNADRYELKLAYGKGTLELNGQSIQIPFVSP